MFTFAAFGEWIEIERLWIFVLAAAVFPFLAGLLRDRVPHSMLKSNTSAIAAAGFVAGAASLVLIYGLLPYSRPEFIPTLAGGVGGSILNLLIEKSDNS